MKLKRHVDRAILIMGIVIFVLLLALIFNQTMLQHDRNALPTHNTSQAEPTRSSSL